MDPSRLKFFLAKSQEMLILFAIAWAVTLAAAGELMGFSGEVGAFLAGVSLASTQFKEAISGRLISLRDFMLIFFRKSGRQSGPIDHRKPGGSRSFVFRLCINRKPYYCFDHHGSNGISKRTAFLAGLTVAQISEFSLIFAGLGLSIGHINDEILALITLVGLITIGLSTYLILYSHQIYNVIAPVLGILKRNIPIGKLKWFN